MTDPKKCTHPILHFGSGDYYIFCDICFKSWVVRGNNDIGDPSRANLSPEQSDVCSQQRIDRSIII
jgi:hypothetical protein